MNIIDINTIYGPYTSAKSEVSVTDLEARLIKSDVEKAVTLSSYGIYHSFRDGNARTAKQCKESDILLAAATIDPRGYFGQIDILEKIKEAGFRLLRFFPSKQNWSTRSIVFEDILEKNNSIGLPVMVDVRKSGEISDLYRVAKSIVNYPIILQGVTFDTMAEAIAVMKRADNFLIETSNLTIPSSIEYLYSSIGSDRILFGSDACEKSIRVARDFVLSASIPEVVKDKIFYINAKRVLGE